MSLRSAAAQTTTRLERRGLESIKGTEALETIKVLADDNKPFHDRGIPVLLLHTGFHEQYHTPRDDWDRINRHNLEIVARCGFVLVTGLAVHAERRPVFRRRKR